MSVRINGITGVDTLKDGLVTESKIAAGAITETKISSGAVTNAKIGALAVDNGKIADSAINSNKIADGAIGYSDFPAGVVLQTVVRYDDTVSATGSGTPNYTYFLDTYITLKRASSTVIINGVWTGHSADDTSLQLQWNLNGGAWNTDSILNSRAYTYSGIADFSWTHLSNRGPFPVALDNFLTAASIGATAGSIVGIRVCAVNENGITYYNRGIDGADNSVNYATARSRMILMEVSG